MHLNLDFSSFSKIIGSAGTNLPADFFLKKIASIEQASRDDVAIVLDRGDAAVFDSIDDAKILATHAACLIASRDIIPGRTCVVNDPLMAYQSLIDFIAKRDFKLFYRDERYPDAFISRDAHFGCDVHIGPGVVVMAGAKINDNVVLMAQSYVGVDAQLGRHVVLHPGAKVLDKCIVGDNSVLHAGAIVGSDGFGYQVTQQGLRKIPQIGIVRVGKHAELGANVAIDRAAFDETIIDDGAKLDNLVSIAHNVHVGRGCAVLAQTCIGGSTRIGAGSLVGAQVAIRDNVVIGNRVKIVSKSGIMENLEDGRVVAGIPAVSFTDWKKIQVILRRLPFLMKELQAVIKPRSWLSRMVKKYFF